MNVSQKKTPSTLCVYEKLDLWAVVELLLLL